ncbi:uncharacterized protein LOC123316274 [Coccinella septempunctata]|uniref:uncharacterized protein LOC123316274 n=1 Tax=Coccinella septempunctata TaxID=41139 RepID=UPI001D0652D9|nr:uncharacterized protein LOC123316274 [Coccinella septempunctata]
MKVIVLVLSAVSVVCGGHAGYPSSYSSSAGPQLHPQEWQGESSLYSEGGWASAQKVAYPQHVPVIHNGVPVETPEVQAAKAHFYQEYARAAALAAQKPDPLNGQYAGDHGHEKYLPVNQGWTAEKRVSYEQPNQIWQNGQEYTNAAYDNNAYNHNAYQNQAYDNSAYDNSAYDHSAYDNSAYDHSAYVPVDTPEVQKAKISHFKAFAAALARASAPRKQQQQHRYRRSASEWAEPKYQGPIHVPHITKEGVPADTPEVQKAKYLHEQALHQAAALAHASGNGEEDHSAWKEEQGHQVYGPPQSAGWPSAPVHTSYKVNHEHIQKWHGPEHMPVLDHSGVPIDTPEVQHARKAHLAALAAESEKHKGWQPEQQWQEEQKW